MKQELSRLENEKRHLQKEIRYSESRATEMEIQRMSLDGDLQRLQMKLQEKEARIEVRNIYHFKEYLIAYKMHLTHSSHACIKYLESYHVDVMIHSNLISKKH